MMLVSLMNMLWSKLIYMVKNMHDMKIYENVDIAYGPFLGLLDCGVMGLHISIAFVGLERDCE